jgi:protein-S-isoprenylcysteine O-methyltransferase Ste14
MPDNNRGIFHYFLQLMFFLSVFALFLFAAGRLNWTAGWIFLAVNAAGRILTALILRVRNPGLMVERASVKGKRDLDRVLGGVLALWGAAAICIVVGLGFRFGWQPKIQPALQIAGVVFASAGAALTAWAMASNRLFCGVISVAAERRHTICDSDPHKIIRHPGNAGAIMFDPAAPLVLQSAWAFLPAAATAIVIVTRSAMEDKALQAGLNDYRGHAGRVPSRLLSCLC